MATARVQLTLEQAQFINGINAAQARIARFGSALRGMALFVAGGFAAKMGTTATFGVVKGATDAAGRIESMTAAMSVFTGQLQTAKDLTVDLMKAGAASPFGSEQYAKAGKALLGFGLSIEQMKKAIPMLSDVAAAVEANLDELAIVFGKNAAQGRLYTRDVNEFATRGIRIWQALADEIGVPITKIRKAVEEGKVGTKEMFGAFERLTSKGGAYQGMTEQFRRTFEGAKKQLEGAWFMFSAKMGEPINRALKPLFADIVGLLQGMEGIASRIGNAIANVVRLVRLAYTDWSGFLSITQQINAALGAKLLDTLLRVANTARAMVGTIVEGIAEAWSNPGTIGVVDKLKLAWMSFKLTALPMLRDSFATLGVAIEGILIGIANRFAVAIADIIDSLPIPGAGSIADRLAPKSDKPDFIAPDGTPVDRNSREYSVLSELYSAMKDRDLKDSMMASVLGRDGEKGLFEQTYGRKPKRFASHAFGVGEDYIATNVMAEREMKKWYRRKWEEMGGDLNTLRHLPSIELGIQRMGFNSLGGLDDIGNDALFGYSAQMNLRHGPFDMRKGSFESNKELLGGIMGIDSRSMADAKNQVQSMTDAFQANQERANAAGVKFVNTFIDKAVGAFNEPTGLEKGADSLWGRAKKALSSAFTEAQIYAQETAMSLREPGGQFKTLSVHASEAAASMNKALDALDEQRQKEADARKKIVLEGYSNQLKEVQKQLQFLQWGAEEERLRKELSGDVQPSSARIATIVADSFAKVGAGGVSIRSTPSVTEMASNETAANTREMVRLQLLIIQLMRAQAQAEDADYFGYN